MLVHLDTDLGGDVDDLCALAMLLAWPGAEITGVTTVGEHGGRRAGYVRRVLRLAGRDQTPVAAGMDVSSGRFADPMPLPSEQNYWDGPVEPLPGPLDAAIDLLRQSINLGATIVAVGPYSNLAALEDRYPGSLSGVPLVLMSGHAFPTRDGFPPWTARDDFNVQADAAAADTVLSASRPLLVPINITVETPLPRAALPQLRESGIVGALLARQIENQAKDERTEERWGRPYPNLPDDTVAFLHDPLACAVALGWSERVRVTEVPLEWERREALLEIRSRAGARTFPIVRAVDGERFVEHWLTVMRRLSEGR